MRYIVFILLFMFHSAYARVDVTIDGDECTLVSIKYSNEHNYIYAKGYCQEIFDMCTEDFCTIEKLPTDDLNFNKRDLDKFGKK